MATKLPASMQDFFSQGKFIHFKNREIVIRPEDTPSGVYYVEKGYVKTYSITVNGEENLHIVYKQKEIFPLMWFLKGIRKNVWFEALGSVDTRRVSKESFKAFLESNSSNYTHIIDMLILQANIFIDRVDNLEITQAYPRTVARILYLAKRFGKEIGKKILIEAPFTHRDIASSINMSRETASKQIEILQKKKLINYKSHLIVIPDIKELGRELLHSYESEPL